MNAPINFPPEMKPPSARWMGMELEEHRPEEMFSRLSFSPPPEMKNFNGVIQGGFLIAMMDDAMGFNCFISLGMKSSQASIDFHTHFLSAVELGPVTVEARVMKAGKSVAFLEAKLFDQNNKLAATASSSSKLRPIGKSSRDKEGK